jgi:HEAT repeat protein
LELLTRFGTLAVPYLLPKLTSTDPERRFYAALMLGELSSAEALDGVAMRLLDPDPRVAGLAGVVVARHVPVHTFDRALYHAVRSTLTNQRAPDVAVYRAVEAAGVLRDVGAVDGLLERLHDARTAPRQAAVRSLRSITGQDFGTSARRWSAWWAGHRARPRAEWLVDALDHRQEQVRARAAQELRRLLPGVAEFRPDAPRRERDEARQRYREALASEARRPAGGD